MQNMKYPFFNSSIVRKITSFFNCWILGSLNLYYNDFMANPNLMASDVLCLNKTRISSLNANLDLCTLLLNKFNALSCYDGHGTIMLYHTNMALFKSYTFTHFGEEISLWVLLMRIRQGPWISLRRISLQQCSLSLLRRPKKNLKINTYRLPYISSWRCECWYVCWKSTVHNFEKIHAWL